MPDLSPFIQPAIILSVAAILIRFFGKVITDQKPLTDDRKYEIELNGLMFFQKYIAICGAIGWYFAIKYNIFNHFGNWSVLVFILILMGHLGFSSKILFEKNYQFCDPSLKKCKKLFEKKYEKLESSYNKRLEWLAKHSPLGIYAIFLSYVFVSATKIENKLWLFIFAMMASSLYILIAVIYSLNKFRPQKANIYLTGEQEPTRDILILKVNDDNIRLRQENRIIILNKSRVEKIELVIDKALLMDNPKTDPPKTLPT